MVVSLQGIGMKRELTREEIEFLKWEKDRDIDYDIFVTIPLHKSYHNKSYAFYDTIKRLLISNLNRSVFTNGEINRGKRLELMLVQEPRENCFHLKIKLPDCDRLYNKKLMYLKIQSMIEKHIRTMKLLNFQKDCVLKSNLKKDDPTRYINLLEWLDTYISLVKYNRELIIENDPKYKPTNNLDEFIN